jgi:hypothetical protein
MGDVLTWLLEEAARALSPVVIPAIVLGLVLVLMAIVLVASGARSLYVRTHKPVESEVYDDTRR